MTLEQQFAEFLDWFKAVNFRALRGALEDVLNEPAKRIAYELTREDRTSGEISRFLKRVGHDFSDRTIRNWQAEWVRVGLVRQVSERKRERIFPLADFGIDVGVDLSKVENVARGASDSGDHGAASSSTE